MYQLTTSIPYLLNRLGVRMGALFSRKIESYGLTLPMYRVLAALSERPNQKLGELAEITTIEPSTMSRLIGSMAAMDLLTRQRPPNDERSVQINLTEKGQQVAVQVMREAQHYEEVAISLVAPNEVQKLRILLNVIFQSLDALEEELLKSSDGAE